MLSVMLLGVDQSWFPNLSGALAISVSDIEAFFDAILLSGCFVIQFSIVACTVLSCLASWPSPLLWFEQVLGSVCNIGLTISRVASLDRGSCVDAKRQKLFFFNTVFFYAKHGESWWACVKPAVPFVLCYSWQRQIGYQNMISCFRLLQHCPHNRF